MYVTTDLDDLLSMGGTNNAPVFSGKVSGKSSVDSKSKVTPHSPKGLHPASVAALAKSASQAHLDPDEIDYHIYIRDKIREQVDECLWLNDLKKLYADLQERLSKPDAAFTEKCMVCTLPVGTCEHTKDWFAEHEKPVFAPDANDKHNRPKRKVEAEIDAALGVLGVDIETIASKPSVLDEVDLTNIRWTQTEPRMSDKLSGEYMSLSTPIERGWHSCTLMGEGKLLVVFGGYRYKKRHTPKAFGLHDESSDSLHGSAQYLNDVHIFDSDNMSWHAPTTIIVKELNSTNAVREVKINPLTGEEFEPDVSGYVESQGPPGRYGHIAAALDSNRLLIFGGRGSNGRFLNDTWIYNLHDATWFQVKPTTALGNSYGLATPPPRVFAAAVSVKTTRNAETTVDIGVTRMFRQSYVSYSNPDKDGDGQEHPGSKCMSSIIPDSLDSVYVFGGTGGSENLSDLWVFKGNMDDMGWEQVISVGSPPSPRYGHKMVYDSRTGTIMLLGGCAVGPYSEIVAGGGSHNDQTRQRKQLFDISSSLQASYAAEGMIAKHGGEALMANVHPEAMNSVDDLVRTSTTENASNVPGIKELTTQAAHVAATVQAQEQQSRALELELADAHYLANADRVFRLNYKASHPDKHLDVHFLDVHHMTWKPQIYPPITGYKPSSRIHFGAMVLGEYCFVVGGGEPTALRNVTADGHGYIRIYALHLPTMVWSNPIPIENTESLEIPLQIAESDIIRAKAQVEEERDRAKALRARRGMTVELAEAEAVLQVCEWRKSMLLKEQTELIPSPQNCFGSTFERIGQRSLLMGGWDNATAIDTTKYLLMLDLEMEHEKRRRLNDEFHAKLERGKQADENKTFLEKLQSSYELRAMIAMEKLNEKRENRRMNIEDICSSLPPLTKPNKVKCLSRNQHTVWVSWNRATMDSFGRHLNKVRNSGVTYKLYMNTGYQRLQADERVLVYSYKKPKVVEQKVAEFKETELESETGECSDDDGTTIADEKAALAAYHSLAALGEGIIASEKFIEATCFRSPQYVLENFSQLNVFRYSGDILKSHHNGFFDVAYDDGGYDYNLPRHRLRLDNVFGPNVLPADASNVAQRRMRSKLIRKFKRRRAYEKRVKKGNMIKKQFGGTSAPPQIGYVPPEEKLVEPLNIIGGNVAGGLHIDTAGSPDAAVGHISESESESDSDDTEWEDDDATVQTHDGGNSVVTAASSVGPSVGSSVTESTVKPKRVKKPKWPVEDRRPHYQLYRYQPYDKQNFTPTVVPDPGQGWHLVYAGTDTSYACTNLVPDSVLAEEPNLSIPVSFIVQTCGTEYPAQEHSLCSDPLVVWTESPKVHADEPEDDETIATRESTMGGSSVGGSGGGGGGGGNESEPLKKRQVVHAMIEGFGRIEIEKRHHYYLSTGVSDHYF